jgi:hypothetical protein
MDEFPHFSNRPFRSVIAIGAGRNVSKLYASVALSLRSYAAAFSAWRGHGLPVAITLGEEVDYAANSAV